MRRTSWSKCSGILKSLSVPPAEVRNKLGIVTIHRLNGLVHARRGLCWVFPGCQDASRPSFLQNFTIWSQFDEFGSLPPSRRPARMTKVLMERTVGGHKSGDCKCSGILKSLSVPPVEVRNKLGIETRNKIGTSCQERPLLAVPGLSRRQ